MCDDNKEDRKVILEKLKDYVRNNNVEAKLFEYLTGEDLIEEINTKKNSFDIIFLDIYMDFLDGIETARIIRNTDLNCNIIFLTSSTFHAIESYDVKATHYLLKPINDEKLNKALQVAFENIQNARPKYLVIKTNNVINKLFYNDILYVESRARVLLVYTKENEILTIYKKLNEFEAELNDQRFLKCHKSFLVNLDFVREVKGYFFVLVNNHSIPISSSVKDTKKVYLDYLVRKF